LVAVACSQRETPVWVDGLAFKNSSNAFNVNCKLLKNINYSRNLATCLKAVWGELSRLMDSTGSAFRFRKVTI
jgi:hypothetical protein